jgi:hypothetical protein
MHSTLLRSAAGALTVLALAAASVIVAAPANAVPLDPAAEIAGGAYTMTLDPSEKSGMDDDLGDWAFKMGPRLVSVSTGCPEGYRAALRSFVVTPDGVETEVAPPRTNTSVADWGLSGSPIKLQAPYAPTFLDLTEAQFPTGINRLVLACAAELPADGAPIGDAKYFVAFLQVDQAAHTWRVVERPTDPGQDKEATTTALAASGTTGTSTTLTATVAPVGASGQVAFSQAGVEIGRATVTNGVATWGVSGLAGDTEYSFTAAYLGDATHEASTSAAITVRTAVVVPPADTEDTEIGVTVPDTTGPSGLRITVAAGGASLTGTDPRVAGQVWNAGGTLPEVTVTDDRRDASKGRWNLNGSATAFAGAAGGFAASNLSWTPRSVAGPGEVGGAADDLSRERTLASGAASAQASVVTRVTADLALKVPSDAAAGAYTSTLTLTLI